jgi:PAS domain S-box-containing protein
VKHHNWVLPLAGIVGILIVSVMALSVSVARTKKAEQAALKSREQFRQVTETIREVFWLASPDWKTVEYVSPPYEQVWGRPPQELLRNPWAWYKSVVKADRPVLRKAIQNGDWTRSDEITLPDFRIRRPDNSIAWISARAFPVANGAGNPERITGIAEDITESKRDEAAIHAIMEVTAGATGQALFDKIVDRISNWLGCEAALIGEIQPDRRVKTLAMIVDGKPVTDFEYELKGTPCEHATQQGFCHHPVNIARLYPEDLILAEMGAVGYVGVPVKDQIGAAVGVLCAISRHELKISPKAEPLMKVIAARASVEIQRKQVEAEKRRLESQLLQSQKMEAIGTLAGGIAHDFNNVLFPILGYAEMLREDLPPNSTLLPGVLEVLAGAKRARDLTKQILAFGRQVRPEIKPIRIQSLLKEVIKLTRSTLPATIEIRQEIDPDCGMVMADPTHIHQVVMNLITNAYHAMENGGVLTIRLNEAEFTQDHPDSEQAAAPCVRLSVEDTGIGMDPATREKIFDPYFSTKEKDKGTGLGLSVVHGIIKNYEGHITVQSAPNRGSVFEIWIPRAAATRGGKREVNTAPLPKGTEHILIVDDEATIARMEKQMLERLGYEVTIRTGSIEALAAFQGNPDQYDLVITDMTMPGMTGDRLALKMTGIRPGLPIILCTGFSERMSAEKAASLGIGGFIMKPVVQSELAALIRKVLEKN